MTDQSRKSAGGEEFHYYVVESTFVARAGRGTTRAGPPFAPSVSQVHLIVWLLF